MEVLKIGTRGSALALAQANETRARLMAALGLPESAFAIMPISTSGDRADCAEVPENAGVWPLVTSTRDNCLGSQCAHYDQCFVMKARRGSLPGDGAADKGAAHRLGVLLATAGVAR